jgi:hypothetical protein
VREAVSEPSQRCIHPWLRVTCGVCGEAVDALGELVPDPTEGGNAPRRRIGGDDRHAVFIVARGHPELLDQLRIVMGQVSGVDIIEDRRQRPRVEPSEQAAREFRKRLREEGQPDQG